MRTVNERRRYPWFYKRITVKYPYCNYLIFLQAERNVIMKTAMTKLIALALSAAAVSASPMSILAVSDKNVTAENSIFRLI